MDGEDHDNTTELWQLLNAEINTTIIWKKYPWIFFFSTIKRKRSMDIFDPSRTNIEAVFGI